MPLRVGTEGRTAAAGRYAFAVLKACVNGARRRGEHPALPVTAAELARDVASVAAAGVDAVHLHVKDDSGADTPAANAMDEVLTAVRAVALGMPIGTTTGAWAASSQESRVAAVCSWRVLPDFASVNWHEDGADDVAAALLGRGVAIEAGLWNIGAVEAWLSSPVRNKCLRVLLELPDGLTSTAVEAAAFELFDALKMRDVEVPTVLLHGEGSSAWPALRLAQRLGFGTRIGLEDTLVLPDESLAPDNSALVRAAHTLLSSNGEFF